MSDSVTVGDVADEYDTLWIVPGGMGRQQAAHVDPECPQTKIKRDPRPKDPETLFTDQPVCEVCYGG